MIYFDNFDKGSSTGPQKSTNIINSLLQTINVVGKVTIHGLGSLGSGLWAPWALGSGQDVLGSRVYWAPEITALSI